MIGTRDGEDREADALAARAVGAQFGRGGEVHLAGAFLPRRKRDAAFAVVAFCEMVREAMGESAAEPAAGAWAMRHRPLAAAAAVDHRSEGVGGSCCSGEVGRRLSLFRERLDEIYTGRLELPSPRSRSLAQHTLHAFARAVERYEIQRAYLVGLAEGCEKDQAVARYATWSSLERHCHAVAGNVALAVGCVLGFTNSSAAEHALKLGAALQLTHILRHLRSDAARDKIYIPLEDLAAYRYTERELRAGVVNDNFRRLLRFEIARARQLFAAAADGLRWVAGDGSRMAAAVVIALSSGLLDSIERHDFASNPTAAKLSPGHKLRRLPIAWRLARRGPASAAATPVVAGPR